MIYQEKQNINNIIIRSMFLGKSAHGAADTDMAGLLGQLQVTHLHFYFRLSQSQIDLKDVSLIVPA